MAEMLTFVFSPPIVLTVLIIVVVWHSSTTTMAAIGLSLVTVTCVCLFPALYVLWGVKNGWLTDIQITERRQRRIPMLLGLVSATAGSAIVIANDAPREVIALFAVVICIFIALNIISMFWKISFHTSTLAGALIIMVTIYGPGLLITIPVVIAVGWARVTVNGHTSTQVLAGAVLGIMVAGVVFPLIL